MRLLLWEEVTAAVNGGATCCWKGGAVKSEGEGEGEGEGEKKRGRMEITASNKVSSPFITTIINIIPLYLFIYFLNSLS